ncbi:glycine receptor subunit alpha-2-like [Haliotis asinina]|uniref:glycine receptor subunit alpha-2-like n=1 Tax=Haliotis asinina TaxID=109174 RepID=UPI003531C998
MWLLAIVALGSIHNGGCSNDTVEASVKLLIDTLLEGKTYDSSIRPSSSATMVHIDIALNALGPVNDRDMKFGASFYLRQEWLDSRLKYNELNNSIVLSYKKLSMLWVPDIFFPQSETELRHDITTPNVLLRLSPEGMVFYSQRVSVEFHCVMDLRKFPMDEQTCEIRMESYAFTTDDILMKWSSGRQSLNVLPNANMPDFELLSVTTHDCTATYATGTFPCLYAKLTLKRQIGFYLTQTYIPSILIVSLSWISFWIDHQAIPARISVGLLTVLTITTQSSGAMTQLPRVPYVKSIDVWMSACLIFVFAAYMEYAVVTVLARRHRKLSMSTRHKETSKQNGSTSSGVYNNAFDNDEMFTTGRIPASRSRSKSIITLKLDGTKDLGVKIDKISRHGFPLAFVLFNAFYWTYYNLIT